MPNDDLIKAVPSKWSKPMEFDGDGKEITIVNFQELLWQDVVEEALKANRTAPQYAPKDGILRRLTFTQADFMGERILDLNTPNFQNDLAGKSIRKGSTGILKRVKPEKGRFKWSWTPTETKVEAPTS